MICASSSRPALINYIDRQVMAKSSSHHAGARIFGWQYERIYAALRLTFHSPRRSGCSLAGRINGRAGDCARAIAHQPSGRSVASVWPRSSRRAHGLDELCDHPTSTSKRDCPVILTGAAAGFAILRFLRGLERRATLFF